MTEEQKKKYEEAAKELFPVEAMQSNEHERLIFLAGAERAHSEGFNQGRNDAIDQAIFNIQLRSDISPEISKLLINELQKLRK